jgi:alpha-1,2-mannosyltransferase
MVRRPSGARLQPHPAGDGRSVGVAWIALSHGGVDRQGKPIGTDFASFWSASRLALTGQAAEAWSVPAHWGAQRALFGAQVGYSAFK